MKKKLIVLIMILFIFIFLWTNKIKDNNTNNMPTEPTENNEITDIVEPTIPKENINLMGNTENGNIRVQGNPTYPLDIPTYIKTDNHAVHPRIIYDKDEKFGYPWIMAFTPYSFMNDHTENPSIVVSNNGVDFFVPEGLENPISGVNIDGRIHYSDPDIFINGDIVELWYRQSNKNTKLSRILRKTSTDLINWTDEEIIFDYGTGEYGFGAPTVVLLNGEYNLYYKKYMYLNDDLYVLRKSTDLINWTDEETIYFDYGEEWSNYNAWHVEINYIDGKFYALNMAYPSLDGTDAVLFAFKSEDGINFTKPIKVIQPTENGFDNKNIYKSTFTLKDNNIWLYYSAFNDKKESYIGLLIGPNFMDLIPVEGPTRDLSPLYSRIIEKRNIVITVLGILGVGYGIYRYKL